MRVMISVGNNVNKIACCSRYRTQNETNNQKPISYLIFSNIKRVIAAVHIVKLLFLTLPQTN